MKNKREFRVNLEEEAYLFYDGIAKSLNRPVEEILSDTLTKYVEILAKKAIEEERKKAYESRRPHILPPC